MYDIAIVGLGPAGSTLARLLAKKLKVVALDLKDRSGGEGFHKPCGGLLATDAQKALSKFSLTLPKSVLVDPQIFAVQTLDTGRRLMRNYQRFYVNMDRHQFDLWLMGLIPEDVSVLDRAAVFGIERINGGFRVRFRRDGEARQIEAKRIVGADGANSILRRSLFPGARIRSYVALQAWYQDKNPRPLYACFFDPEITDCYAWSISKDGRLIVGGAFPKADCKRRFDLLKEKLVREGYVLGEPVKTEACAVLRPLGFFDFATGADGAFLIGEAAGFISPSSLEGISYALDSARILAHALAAPNPNASYDRAMLPMRLKLSTKNLKSLFMYVPALRRLVMKSGLNSIKLVK